MRKSGNGISLKSDVTLRKKLRSGGWLMESTYIPACCSRSRSGTRSRIRSSLVLSRNSFRDAQGALLSNMLA